MIRLEAFSRFLNVMIGGSEYESLSARAYRAGNEKWINWIFFWQKNHCRGAYNNGLKRMNAYYINQGRKDGR